MISIEDIKDALFRVDRELPGYIAQAKQSSSVLTSAIRDTDVFDGGASGIATALAGAADRLTRAGVSVGELSKEIKGAINKISM